jgi:hypothetical protein
MATAPRRRVAAGAVAAGVPRRPARPTCRARTWAGWPICAAPRRPASTSARVTTSTNRLRRRGCPAPTTCAPTICAPTICAPSARMRRRPGGRRRRRSGTRPRRRAAAAPTDPAPSRPTGAAGGHPGMPAERRPTRGPAPTASGLSRLPVSTACGGPARRTPCRAARTMSAPAGPFRSPGGRSAAGAGPGSAGRTSVAATARQPRAARSASRARRRSFRWCPARPMPGVPLERDPPGRYHPRREVPSTRRATCPVGRVPARTSRSAVRRPGRDTRNPIRGRGTPIRSARQPSRSHRRPSPAAPPVGAGASSRDPAGTALPRRRPERVRGTRSKRLLSGSARSPVTVPARRPVPGTAARRPWRRSARAQPPASPASARPGPDGTAASTAGPVKAGTPPPMSSRSCRSPATRRRFRTAVGRPPTPDRSGPAAARSRSGRVPGRAAGAGVGARTLRPSGTTAARRSARPRVLLHLARPGRSTAVDRAGSVVAPVAGAGRPRATSGRPQVSSGRRPAREAAGRCRHG